MSLADRILRYGVLLPAPIRASPACNEGTRATATRYNEAVKEIISRGPVIHIDAAVSVWLDSPNLKPEDLPCLAPPFPSFFMESRNVAGWPFGVMAQAFSPQEFPYADVLKIDAERGETLNTELTWLLELSSIILWPGGVIPEGPQTTLMLGIGSKGELTKITDRSHGMLSFQMAVTDWTFSPLEMPEKKSPVYDALINWFVQKRLLRPNNGMFTIDPVGVIQWDMESHLYPPLFAISLMHCKNVHLVNGRRCSPTAGAYRRRKNKPVVFKVLDIEPMRKVLRHEGGMASGNSLKRAIHICRGHFKDYRHRGLFGKLKGIYWWDMHLRGSADAGVVVKEYRIKQSKQKVSGAV